MSGAAKAAVAVSTRAEAHRPATVLRIMSVPFVAPSKDTGVGWVLCSHLFKGVTQGMVGAEHPPYTTTPEEHRLVWRGVRMDDGLRLRIVGASRTAWADSIEVSALDRFLGAA